MYSLKYLRVSLYNFVKKNVKYCTQILFAFAMTNHDMFMYRADEVRYNN